MKVVGLGGETPSDELWLLFRIMIPGLEKDIIGSESGVDVLAIWGGLLGGQHKVTHKG
jgi:hypothetical protein